MIAPTGRSVWEVNQSVVVAVGAGESLLTFGFTMGFILLCCVGLGFLVGSLGCLTGEAGDVDALMVFASPRFNRRRWWFRFAATYVTSTTYLSIFPSLPFPSLPDGVLRESSVSPP